MAERVATRENFNSNLRSSRAHDLKLAVTSSIVRNCTLFQQLKLIYNLYSVNLTQSPHNIFVILSKRNVSPRYSTIFSTTNKMLERRNDKSIKKLSRRVYSIACPVQTNPRTRENKFAWKKILLRV